MARDVGDVENRGNAVNAPDAINRKQLGAIIAFFVLLMVPGVLGLTLGRWTSCLYPPRTPTPTVVETPVPATPRPTAATAAGSTPVPVPAGSATQTFDLGRVALELQRDAENYRDYSSCLNHFNESLDQWIKISAVVAALFTTVSSSFSWRALGVVSGAIAVAAAGLQTTFPTADQAAFYAKIASRADGVAADMKYGIVAAPSVPEFIDRERAILQSIKFDAAQGPTGQLSGTPTVLPATPTVTPSPTVTASPTVTSTVSLPLPQPAVSPQAATPTPIPPAATPTPTPSAAAP